MKITRSILKISEALVILGVFGYLAWVMFHFDNLGGRQFFLVILIASVMISIFGKIAAAIITLVIGLAGFVFMLTGKDDEDKPKIIKSKRV
ncbi:hypothetical protein ACFOTA_08095 [Chitinophaga sp. GCM10012297]|uniref:Uncharacterized protein n=1 Tax=Chitinophaga chungangae TaxID=2821488 RepID=A0ABS3YBX4_9BACT|nr:hypothetical protein [Chitinophaga chungangae]MBO9152164.1 hypothetical protein [Chitinophaga chungangae]